MRKLQPGKLVLASHNKGKLREFAGLLAPHGMELISAGEFGLPEPEETGDTFLANATLKAMAAARATGLPALADDSGLEVAALGGQPGVRTADWAMRPDGTRDYPAAMARIASLDGSADRRCAFVAVLVLAWPDRHTESFEGRVEGRWVAPPRGQSGFGYDPIFVPDGESATFGEMTAEQKARHSHRARAFAALAAASLG
ncbi:RdgB/HAM1 family non-canonical purine NTP pyrophosphatase [Roseococcus sp. SYP-B2431]|uniref:RdgB/HAM1 family non-canonical purine NTP pyrophosphatase n=1 Tax=Roseococcus sp. SYP-B2431 TaxID=2496640 RepID=UPI00103E14EE|nr:RdgB/HAM1 family non-canonical purine NTP pyrophosphatase [Roseococcus sp. SYP-B2431]TCH98639.1 RdgB/HAM1 family non-canonical purine NTP pyrophosphatase [Roseococcus sp. SYP-B2431]